MVSCHFIYLFYKITSNFNDSFHKTTDERYFENKTVQYYVWYNLGMIGVLLIMGL
jgi:hypothetical protein